MYDIPFDLKIRSDALLNEKNPKHFHCHCKKRLRRWIL